MRITAFPVISLVLLTAILGTAVPVAGEDGPVGFEHAEPGQFDRLETAIGAWVSEAGRATVSEAVAHLHEVAGPSFYLRTDVHTDRASYPALKARLRRGLIAIRKLLDAEGLPT